MVKNPDLYERKTDLLYAIEAIAEDLAKFGHPQIFTSTFFQPLC